MIILEGAYRASRGFLTLDVNNMSCSCYYRLASDRTGRVLLEMQVFNDGSSINIPRFEKRMGMLFPRPL